MLMALSLESFEGLGRFCAMEVACWGGRVDCYYY